MSKCPLADQKMTSSFKRRKCYSNLTNSPFSKLIEYYIKIIFSYLALMNNVKILQGISIIFAQITKKKKKKNLGSAEPKQNNMN